MLNLNKFAEEVHENAKAHGWWDEPRTFPEICALIHSEWSEALEEARAGRPLVWYACNVEYNPCIPRLDCLNAGNESECPSRGNKPEGIAVELIDGVIRILDWIGKERVEIFPVTINSIMEIWSKERKDKLSEATLPQVVARLHYYTSNAYSESGKQDRGDYLIAAMQTVFFWLDSKGVDVENVLVTKHEFNKTRAYKHGKKF